MSTTPDVREQLQDSVRALDLAGIRTGAIKLNVRVADGVVHGRPWCLSTPTPKTEKFLSLKALVNEKVGAICRTCLKEARIRSSSSSRDMLATVARYQTLTALMSEHETSPKSYQEALRDVPALTELAHATAHDGASILRDDTRTGLMMLLEDIDARQRGDEGYTAASTRAAEILFPMPDAAGIRSTLDDASRARIEDMVEAQRAAALSSPNWVLADVVSMHGRSSASPSWELFRMRNLFTTNGILSVPAVVFEAFMTMELECKFTVLPERPSDALVETVAALYDPIGSGPFAMLDAATKAAETLA